MKRKEKPAPKSIIYPPGVVVVESMSLEKFKEQEAEHDIFRRAQILNKAEDKTPGSQFDAMFAVVKMVQAGPEPKQAREDFNAWANDVHRRMGKEVADAIAQGNWQWFHDVGKALKATLAHVPRPDPHTAVLMRKAMWPGKCTVKELNDELVKHGYVKMDPSQLRRWAAEHGILIAGGTRGRPREK